MSPLGNLALGALGAVPSFHTLGRSLPVLAGAAGKAHLLGRASRFAGDLPPAVPAPLDHYVWPVLATPAPPAGLVRGHVLGYAAAPAFAAELGLLGVAPLLVVRDHDRGVETRLWARWDSNPGPSDVADRDAVQ